MPTNKDTQRPIDPAENFASHLRHRRQLIEMSQVELADAMTDLGFPMAQQTIAKIESGKRPIRLDEASVLATAVGSTLPQMLQPPIALTPSVIKASLRHSREAVAELEQKYAEAEEAHTTALRAVDEASAQFAAVRRQLALQRDQVDALTNVMDEIERAKGARGGKH